MMQLGNAHKNSPLQAWNDVWKAEQLLLQPIVLSLDSDSVILPQRASKAFNSLIQATEVLQAYQDANTGHCKREHL